nr:MAG TPA: hypothetical protein [Caudoviricetes sp.]
MKKNKIRGIICVNYIRFCYTFLGKLKIGIPCPFTLIFRKW